MLPQNDELVPAAQPAAQPPATRKVTARGAVAWVFRALLALVFVLGAVTSLTPQGRTVARTATLLTALVRADQPVVLQAIGDDVRHTERVIRSAGGPVYLDIYEPAGPPPIVPGAREGLVIIPGVGDNRQVEQLVNFATALARNGLVAMLMTTDTWIAYALAPVDADAVAQAVLQLRQWPGVNPDQVGILGFSAGGAIASLTAARPDMRGRIAFLTLFGGYFDARSLLLDVGRRAISVDGKLEPWQPDSVPLTVLGNTLAPTLPGDDAALIRQAFGNGFNPLAPDEVKRMTPEGQAAYHLLAGDQPDRAEENLRALPPQAQLLLEALSPSNVVQRIQTPIHLLHDKADVFVPFTQSRAFAAALDREQVPHTFTELSIFQHVEVRSSFGRDALIRDATSLYRVIYSILLPSA